MDEHEEELHRCARIGSTTRMKFLLEEKGLDPDVSDQVGRTALHRASISGQAGAIEVLLEHGADVNKRTNAGDNALMFTCQNLSIESFSTLMRYGADPDLENEAGITPRQRLETSINPKAAKLYQMLPEEKKDPFVKEELSSGIDGGKFTDSKTSRSKLVKIALPHPTIHKDVARELRTKLDRGEDPHHVAIEALALLEEILYDVCLDSVEMDVDSEFNTEEGRGETCLRLLVRDEMISSDTHRNLGRFMALLWHAKGVRIAREKAEEIVTVLDDVIHWTVQLD